MRKISYWAKIHPSKAIAVIVLLKVMLAVLAVSLGLQLSNNSMRVPGNLLWLCAVAMILCIVAYPSQKKGRSVRQYYRQKTCDFLIGLSSFLCIMTVTNNPQQTGWLSPFSLAHSFTFKPGAAEILTSLKENPGKKLTREEKKILKKEFYKQLKIYAKCKLTHDKEGGDKALLILLTIIGAVGFLFLLAALVCELSCSGSETGALILAILGTAGIIWATVAIVRNIQKKNQPKKEISPGDKP